MNNWGHEQSEQSSGLDHEYDDVADVVVII